MAILFVNGRFVPESEAGISPLDRGFLFADAIYEVVRYDRGRPYRLAEHLSRMREGLNAIRIPATPGLFSCRRRTAARRERPGGQGRAGLRAGLPGRRSALPRLPAAGHAAHGLRVREGDRPAPAPRGREGDPPDRRALGPLRHQERHAAAQRAGRAEGARGRRLRRDPRPRRVRARGDEGQPVPDREGRPAHRPERTADPAGCHARRRDRGRSPARARRSRNGRSPSRKCTRRRRSSSPRRPCGPTPSCRSKGGRSAAEDPARSSRCSGTLSTKSSGPRRPPPPADSGPRSSTRSLLATRTSR